MALLFADIHKDSPSVGDVHVSTAMGNGAPRRRRLFKPFLGQPAKDITPPTGGAVDGNSATVDKAARTPAVMLKPFDEDTVHTPFLYDAHAFDRLREDQKPRFLGAVTGPGRLPLRTVHLDSLVAMQNRVDPGKVAAMRGPATMVGWTKPVVTRFADRDYIADGHHRLTAAALDGQDQFEVHYLDLTRESNALKRDGSGTATAGTEESGASWSTPFQITKADPDRQMIFGWASVVTKNGEAVIDRQGDIIPVPEMENAAYNFVLFARQHGDMHRKVGTGRLIESMAFTLEKQDALGIVLKDETGDRIEAWWTGFLVDDADLWAAHKRGERPEFSIGGMAVPEEVPE